MNRVKLLVGGKPTWVTVPIVRSDGSVREVREVRIDDSQPWRKKLLRTIELNYRRTPYFDEVFPLVDELVTTPTESLADYNEHGVRRIAGELGIDASKIVRSSEIPTHEHGTDLLIELTRAVGGTAYMCGRDAPRLYQDDAKFSERGVELVHQSFEDPTYSQPVDAPVHGLSVVDALMNCGLAGTRELVEHSAMASR